MSLLFPATQAPLCSHPPFCLRFELLGEFNYPPNWKQLLIQTLFRNFSCDFYCLFVCVFSIQFLMAQWIWGGPQQGKNKQAGYIFLKCFFYYMFFLLKRVLVGKCLDAFHSCSVTVHIETRCVVNNLSICKKKGTGFVLYFNKCGHQS